MAARLIGNPQWRFWKTSDSTALANGKVYFYSPGTTDVKDIYDDTDKATTLDNPVTLTSGGFLSNPVYGEGFYDIRIETSAGAEVETISNWGDDWSAVGTDLNENIVSNHSFETAGTGGEPFANWTKTDSGSVISRDTSDSYHGTACLLFTNSQSGNDSIISDFCPVTPGKDVFIEFALKCSNASAVPIFTVNWYTAAQSSISTTTYFNSNAGTSPTSWEVKGPFNVTPPATARYAKFYIQGNNSGTQYTVRVDDFRPYQKVTSSTVSGSVIEGLNISIDAGDTDHDINVTAGACLDSTLSELIILPSEITKQIDAGWAVGDDAGGIAAGSSLSADGHLNVFVGKKSGTGLVDVFFDDGDYDSPTPPSGFDFYRYLGRVCLDSSSNICDGVWDGPFFVKKADPAYEVNSTVAYDQATQTAAINAPPYAEIDYLARLEVSSGQASDLVIQIRPADAAWDATRFGTGMEVTDIIDEIWSEGKVVLDSSSQIDWDFTIAGHTGNVIFQFNCVGWHDRKRDNP